MDVLCLCQHKNEISLVTMKSVLRSFASLFWNLFPNQSKRDHALAIFVLSVKSFRIECLFSLNLIAMCTNKATLCAFFKKQV